MRERTTAAAGDAHRRVWRRAAAQDGFTLAEMLVVLAILGTVLAGLTVLFTAAMKTHTDQTNRANAQQDARVALDKLRRELHCSSALTYNSASSVTVTMPPYCTTAPSATAASPVTWCVTSAGPPHTLRRYVGDSTVAGGACANAGGVASTSLLVSSSVFTSYTRPAAPVSAPTFTEATSGGTIRPGSYTYDVTGVTPNGEFSGTPTHVTVTGGATGSTSNTLTLSWSTYTDPTGAAATSYRIYRRDDGSITSEGLRLLATVTAPTTSYTDTGTAITSLSSQSPPLATLNVSLLADQTPADSSQRFTLNDAISLRNSGRY
jgi:prepilin-type N-terminal cleavage/methylation domain-containing protein